MVTEFIPIPELKAGFRTSGDQIQVSVKRIFPISHATAGKRPVRRVQFQDFDAAVSQVVGSFCAAAHHHHHRMLILALSPVMYFTEGELHGVWADRVTLDRDVRYSQACTRSYAPC